MKELTKKFRVLHKGNILINEQIEFEEGSVTYVPDGVAAVEFDYREAAKAYIRNNNLVYDEYTDED